MSPYPLSTDCIAISLARISYDKNLEKAVSRMFFQVAVNDSRDEILSFGYRKAKPQQIYLKDL